VPISPGRVYRLPVAQIQYLQDPPRRPGEETPTLRRVVQSARHPLWRVSHPYEPKVAVRLIVSSVSRLEAQSDMLLSTFASYLAAVGTHPRVVVTVDGHDVELDLHALSSKP